MTAQHMVLLSGTARCSRLHEIVPFCKMRHRSGSTAKYSLPTPTARPDSHWCQGGRRGQLPDGSASWWACSLLQLPWWRMAYWRGLLGILWWRGLIAKGGSDAKCMLIKDLAVRGKGGSRVFAPLLKHRAMDTRREF